MNGKSGFSMIEVLVAMMLLVGVSALAFSSFSTSAKVQQSPSNVAANLSRELIEQTHEEVRRDWWNAATGEYSHNGKLTGQAQSARTLNSVTYNRSVDPDPVDIDGDGIADYHRMKANVQW